MFRNSDKAIKIVDADNRVHGERVALSMATVRAGLRVSLAQQETACHLFAECNSNWICHGRPLLSLVLLQRFGDVRPDDLVRALAHKTIQVSKIRVHLPLVETLAVLLAKQ